MANAYEHWNGDASAFAILYDHLSPSVIRFTRRLLGGVEYGEEITQNSFLALYHNINRIESADYLLPFLYKVVRNLCYDHLRKQGRYQTVCLDDSIEQAYIDIGQVHDDVDRMLLYTQVREAVDRLPEQQRQTLILYLEEDLSYRQIAEAMNTDIGTVKSRIHYGRMQLLKLLDPNPSKIKV